MPALHGERALVSARHAPLEGRARMPPPLNLHCFSTRPALRQAVAQPDLPPGDLVYEMRELRHPCFERRGDDLLCTMTVPLHQARLFGRSARPALPAQQQLQGMTRCTQALQHTSICLPLYTLVLVGGACCLLQLG